ncbi:MAG: hypothetical protein FWE28_02940 [Oscillospiraceae bacterium]|nr:hypothetical protein [Oscillospiraceae bacterium]
MSIGKRVTYLKGLVEGLSLGSSTKEEKILHAIIDILGDISTEMEEIEKTVEQLDDDIMILAEELERLVETDNDCGCGCGSHRHDHAHHDKGRTPTFYTVCCPGCQKEITIDEEVLKLGTIDCPNCGEALELEFDEDEE